MLAWNRRSGAAVLEEVIEVVKGLGTGHLDSHLRVATFS